MTQRLDPRTGMRANTSHEVLAQRVLFQPGLSDQNNEEGPVQSAVTQISVYTPLGHRGKRKSSGFCTKA